LVVTFGTLVERYLFFAKPEEAGLGVKNKMVDDAVWGRRRAGSRLMHAEEDG
jgi:hypothetical protein